MYVDSQLLMSDAQAFTADAVTTNVIDLGSMSPVGDPGAGEPMTVVIQVDVAADATTGDETYAFQVNTSASADLSTPTTIVQRTISRTLLTAGSLHFINIPSATYLRYLGVNFDGGGTTPTITATIFLTPSSMIQVYRSYAKNYTIS